VHSHLVQKIVQIFAEVLGTKPEQIDVDANFFAMGGDSIMGVQIITKASQMGIEIAPELLFENPSVSHIAKAIEAKGCDVYIEQKRLEGKVPLTPVQKNILCFNQLKSSENNFGV